MMPQGQLSHLTPLVDIVEITMEEEGLDSYVSVMSWLKTDISYKRDIDQWHVPDYWQSPEETLYLKTGDCEDYCILAKSMLKKLGYEYSVIRVLNKENGNAHALLSSNNTWVDSMVYEHKDSILKERYSFKRTLLH